MASIKWYIVTHPIVQTDDPETDASRCQLDRHNVRIHGWLLRNDVIAPANESYATWLVRGASLSHRETYFSYLLLYFEIIIEFYCIRRVHERKALRHVSLTDISRTGVRSYRILHINRGTVLRKAIQTEFLQFDGELEYTRTHSCTHQEWETWHFEFKFLIRHAVRCVCIKFCRKLRRVLR